MHDNIDLMVQGFMSKAGNTQTNFYVKEVGNPETKLNSLVGEGTGARAATAMATTMTTDKASSSINRNM